MRKILIFSLLFLLALSSSARSGKKIPQGSYMWEDFEKAKAEAIEKKRPLLMMYTNLKST